MNGRDYFFKHGLDQLVAENNPDAGSDALAPDAADLARLHSLLRKRRVARVLEFGVGFSTLVIADALAKNEAEFAGEGAGQLPPDAHMVTSVDTSESWISIASGRIPSNLRRFVTIQHSTASIGLFNGQICHFYDRLPDVVPEFVYLDGPDPRDVTGTINGIGFSNPDRTVLAADLLLLEPTLLPGTIILVDGRSNNVRFLTNNFRRVWHAHLDPEGSFATLELNEDPLGARNKARLEFCLVR